MGLNKFAAILNVEPNQLRTVAELYNPERFQKHVHKHGLRAGEAFDLKLGHDLLNAKTRDQIRQYFRTCKPDLTMISPPCTLYTLLQNLNCYRDTEEHLKQLREAKILLRFGIEIAFTILDYGGHFVFEHPLTSRAWLDQEMQKLINNEQVKMVATDQCYFGLCSPSGKLHKKPTGFLTSCEEIVQELDHRCNGEHEHEHVIGKVQGVNRSRLAQHYPNKLVDAILRGFRKNKKVESKIHWTQVDEILQLGKRDQVLYREMLTVERETEIAEIYAMADEIPAVEDEIVDEGDLGEIENQRPLPREAPFSTEQLVRRAHEGLGHPGNDRLARILKNAKATDEAIQIAKNLKCSVRQQHASLRPARRAAPPRQLHVNEIVGIDSVYIPGPDGGKRLALNIVDWASRFQMIIPLERHTAPAARRAYLQWVRFFGPPTKIYPDLGREFKGAFELGAELDSTILEPSALEMPSQRGITERAGKNFKEVFSRTLMGHACQDDNEWKLLVDVACMTVNRLMNKSGYSPIQRVLGYSPRLPGGLLTGGQDDLSTVSRAREGGDVQVQKAMAMRLAAAKAFHEADCSQSLANALHGGRRPVLDYEIGQVVYFWRKGMEGAKKDSPEYWRGPARVILTSPPSTVWVNFNGYVVKAAPEHLRLASEEERFALSSWMEDLSETRRELENQPRRGYIDLTGAEFPTDEAFGDAEQAEQPELQDRESHEPKHPRFRLHGKRDASEVIFKEDNLEDSWMINPNRLTLMRFHQHPRQGLCDPHDQTEFRDSPLDKSKLTGTRRTYGKDVHTGEDFVLVDDWTEIKWQEESRNPWTGYTEFDIKPEVSYRELTIGIPKKSKTESMNQNEDHPMTVVSNAITPQPEPEEVEMEEDEEPRGEVRARDQIAEDPEEPADEQRESKKQRTEFLDIFLTSVEKMLASKMKKEVNFRQLDSAQRKFFLKAIDKEIKNNISTQAYEILSPEESERVRRETPEKIVTSRFVLTEKPIEPEDVDKARTDGVLIKDEGEDSTKAKARHVMKGFSEDGAEDLETTTPQCGRETVLCTLQLICSHKWVPGFLDFTQAFHSGDKIQRELYASQPGDCPLPGFQPRQLLRLLKTCYGLLDGPFAWYQHLHRVLTTQLGYTQSAGDPCFFFLRNADGSLEGVISVATDDLLHGGGALHWEKMEWLNKNYKLGKFSSGNGRFVGKEIKCQGDGSFLVHQPMFAKKVEPIPLSRERKQEKYAYCNEKEISQLRGLLGSLSWLAKETRPDLTGRVALLQQTMPHPYIQDLLEANSLAKEPNSSPRSALRSIPFH